ncbi:hypothetical protein ACHWQZ_G001149 [Mnemiopsis leidyi]
MARPTISRSSASKSHPYSRNSCKVASFQDLVSLMQAMPEGSDPADSHKCKVMVQTLLDAEKQFIDKLLDFRQNSNNFKNWNKVRHLKSDSIKYAAAKRKRSLWGHFKLISIGLIAYFCYMIELDRAISESECLLPSSEMLQEFFRPPVMNCSFCQIDNIHIRSNLSEDVFYDQYAYSGRPILVSDGMRDWTTSIFNFNYFKNLYQNRSHDGENCQFFPYKTGFLELQDVFNMDPSRASFKPGHKPWYIGWSNCDPTISKALRRHYKVPYFLSQSERTSDDWMFMGSPGYKGAPLHIDDVDYNSWQAQIHGRKKWKFVPPPECWYECPKSHTITVEPGNIFVFDSNRWYHSTEVLEGEFSLTIGAEYD